MKNIVLISVWAVSASLFANDGHKCASETQACLDKMTTYLINTAWDGIQVDGIGDESGLVSIFDITPGSPGELAGAKVGDLLISMNGKDLAGMTGDQLATTMKSIKVGDHVPLVIERKGKRQKLDMIMATIPDETVSKWVGAHMVKHHANPNAQI